jgi:predicted RNA-binding protein with PIN domain
MPYLIDGYNLAHAMNLLPARSAQRALKRARVRLLDHLAQTAPEESIRVVFDAQAAPRGAPTRLDHQGIVVLFSNGATADDLIEDLIAAEPDPRRLHVVSDDHRIRRAAGRRGCGVVGCLDFLEKLLVPAKHPEAPSPPPPEDEKPATLSAEDDELLRDLDDNRDDGRPGW